MDVQCTWMKIGEGPSKSFKVVDSSNHIPVRGITDNSEQSFDRSPKSTCGRQSLGHGVWYAATLVYLGANPNLSFCSKASAKIQSCCSVMSLLFDAF